MCERFHLPSRRWIPDDTSGDEDALSGIPNEVWQETRITGLRARLLVYFQT